MYMNLFGIALGLYWAHKMPGHRIGRRIRR